MSIPFEPIVPPPDPDRIPGEESLPDPEPEGAAPVGRMSAHCPTGELHFRGVRLQSEGRP
ncbi:hypothetical protein SAMN02927900_06371 [Rhizobium mongolense subsp. loessense]|uniref:Uncharacterized protein n=1 Tax=Rhizobium mongolense subsp. loessense TaxID=158890 RepID=A0A1G4UBJ5_9HYPH|nr:hypothetical protein SAMN02927900_06371 [Rhizobium mongolense subsp. loessense]